MATKMDNIRNNSYLPFNSLLYERMKIKGVAWDEEGESFSNERESHGARWQNAIGEFRVEASPKAVANPYYH